MRDDREVTAPAILFLCLGNICRSPLAEGAARAAFADAGIAATLDSAGTGDWHVGRPPDPRALAEARRRGVDISDLRARALAPADATARLMLMLDLVRGRAGDSVTDPYYGADDGFAETWDDVSAVAAALVVDATGSSG